MSFARIVDWRRTRARAEALLTHDQYLTILQARAARRKQADQEWHEQPPELPVPLQEEPESQINVPSPDESDAQLSARFRDAPKGATEWPGLRSEFDQKSGRAEFLGAPIKLQVQEEKTPAARGQKVEITNPVRIYATQYWLSPDGGGVMLPGFHERFGKGPVFAKTNDGRLHLMDGHHTLFDHLRNGGGAIDAFVFDVPVVSFQDGKKFDPDQPRDEAGKWSSGGGAGGGAEAKPATTPTPKPEAPSRPQSKIKVGKGVSNWGQRRVERALAAIPDKHAALIKDVPIHLARSTSTTLGKHGADTIGLFRNPESGRKSIALAERHKYKFDGQRVELPVMDLERVTIHELGHALDNHFGWGQGKDIESEIETGIARLNETQQKTIQRYITKSPHSNTYREAFAELYTLAHNPTKNVPNVFPTEPVRYFGGNLSRTEAETTFAEALAKVKEIVKTFPPISLRAATAEPIDDGVYVNSRGDVFLVIAGSEYQIDATDTPLAKLAPGNYTDDEVAAALAHKKFDPDQPRDEGGKWTSGGGDGGGSNGGDTAPVPEHEGNPTAGLAEVKRALPKLAEVAQKVYDEWEQNEEGIDEEFGTGGICDEITSQMMGVLAENGIETALGGQPGDEHAWVLANLEQGVYSIDIPPYVYEIGGGYKWEKIPDVTISVDDIVIERIDGRMSNEEFREKYEEKKFKPPKKDLLDSIARKLDTTLARAEAERARRKFDPDQPRDEGGKWTSGGGDGAGAVAEAKPPALPSGLGNYEVLTVNSTVTGEVEVLRNPPPKEVRNLVRDYDVARVMFGSDNQFYAWDANATTHDHMSMMLGLKLPRIEDADVLWFEKGKLVSAIGNFAPKGETEGPPIKNRHWLRDLLARAKAERKFDPDQPRDEGGKWTSGGGAGGAGGDSKPSAAPSVASRPGRTSSSKPSQENIAKWTKQIDAQLDKPREPNEDPKARTDRHDQLYGMKSALRAYAATEARATPLPAGIKYGINAVHDDDGNLQAVTTTKYDKNTNTALILNTGGLSAEDRVESLERTIVRADAEGMQRVESFVLTKDDERFDAHIDAGFKVGGLQPTEGITRMVWGKEEKTEGEIKIEKEREARVAAHREMIANQTETVAKNLGFDASKISLSANDGSENFTLNGMQYKAAGVAHLAEGTIRLYPDQITGKPEAQGVTAHEIKHIKFETAMDKSRAEREAFNVAVPLGQRPDARNLDGTLKPEFAAKFPAYAAMEEAIGRYKAEHFATTDGVSNYSAEYWTKFDGDQSYKNFQLAVHETLAEMAKAKYTTGKFPPHKPPLTAIMSLAEKQEGMTRWRDLYSAVEKVWQLPA